jgi:succinate dehydrogenase / fumarate reductase cytochrome b subunit
MNTLPASAVGRKILMAASGQILVFFILFHIIGNSTIFFHKLNAYVVGLHHLTLLVWGGRFVLLAAFVVHIYYGTVLKLENYAAKPQAYAVSRFRQATFSGRFQIWTGVAVLAFLVYHLLQFTFLVLIDPSIAPPLHPDVMGRPDVFMMVVRSFQEPGIALAYLISLGALMMHLLHGIQSSFQTWGLTSETTLPAIEKYGSVASILLFLWYSAIPVVIILGILKG